MKIKLSMMFILLFASSAAVAENVTFNGVFLDAAEQASGQPIMAMKAKDEKLVAQLPVSQKDVALSIKRGSDIEITCPKDDVVKAVIADMDYMANKCTITSINSKKIQH